MQYGIPVGNIPVARALTLPGYANAVAAGARKRGDFQKAAVGTVALMLNNDVFNGARNSYHKILAADMYQLNGLGDDVTPPAFDDGSSDTYDLDFVNSLSQFMSSDAKAANAQTSAPESTDSGFWGSIVKTIAGPLATGVGLGVGGKIAGVNPWAKPVIAPGSAPMSTTTKLLLAGGGILVGGYVLSRLLKKS